MSTTIASRREPPYRPFQCVVCHARFSRGENLKRHTAVHNQPQERRILHCPLCPVTFSRSDLRHRHMKRKHPQHESQQPSKLQRHPSVNEARQIWPEQIEERGSSQEIESQTADLHCALSSTGEGLSSADDSLAIDLIIQNATSLEQNLLMGTTLFDRPQEISHPRFDSSAVSPPFTYQSSPININTTLDISDTLLVTGLTPPQERISLSPSQINCGCDLFFTHVSSFVPFLHQSTFDATQLPLQLILGMLSLGYQYGEDPDSGHLEGSGVSLSWRCFHQARVLIASEETNTSDFSSSIATVQSYLLLQICAMMYLCGADSAYGLKMHSNMISLARASGMMQPEPPGSSPAQDLDSLWRDFVKAESHKRTLFAVHQIDALWYQFLSVPRSISHLEIKHELPCPESQWSAVSSAEWAHRRLLVNSSGPSVRYADAVRLFLSSDSDLAAIPAFDPYGAINIAQFLISSAREISGWSTMTGMLSMERFGCLKTSLATLLPFISPEVNAVGSTNSAVYMATWQTAMLELQLWSPSHTGGIVGGTLDAMLQQSTELAPSYDFSSDIDTAKAIEPHVQWFLRYLDETLIPDAEAPWVTLYAYKAFLNAWQLVCGGESGAMQVVGVADGDLDGATNWARMVFGRRRHWKLGQLIMSCLDTLEPASVP
ncbi:fungal-specific transcription factor domain-containing protein [Penicillium herquei]|nr:fungal-specific transcription factor domain-containing protein [Penicillium herquei]